MGKREEAIDAVLDKVKQACEINATPTVILKLAEAYAWLAQPNQPHGGSSNTGK